MCRCGNRKACWNFTDSTTSSTQIEDAPYEEGVDPRVEMEQNLEVITRGIPEYATIVGVPL